MRVLGSFLKDKSGNFGILTAVLLVPIVGAAGMAVDYGHALSVRSDLMDVADSAALGAISEGSAGYKAYQAMTEDGEVTIAENDGKAFFLAQRSSSTTSAELADMPIDVDINVARLNGQVTSTATFTAQIPTTFMRVLGQDSIKVSGAATAVYGAQSKSYTNFYMLLDNTPSMGIAATQTEMDRLSAITGANGGRACALACHIGYYGSNGKFNENPDSTYIAARNNDVTLRIDVVSKAAEALIDKVNTASASADQYHIAAYSFGSYALEPGYRIEKVTSLTVDMASASNAVGKVGLMTTDHDHFNDNALTSFDTALTAIGKEISGDGGTGSSAADPQKIVYFVTDGVGDSLKPGGTCGGNWYDGEGRCLEPIDTKYCTALKNRGIKMAVLYTTYIPLTGDDIWENHMKNIFASKIKTKLQQCASDDLFFEVGPEDDMENAMTHLFVKATSGGNALRLTN